MKTHWFPLSNPYFVSGVATLGEGIGWLAMTHSTSISPNQDVTSELHWCGQKTVFQQRSFGNLVPSIELRSGRKRPRCPKNFLLVSVSYDPRLHVKGKVDVVFGVRAKTMNYWLEKLCFSKGRLEIWSRRLNWRSLCHLWLVAAEGALSLCLWWLVAAEGALCLSLLWLGAPPPMEAPVPYFCLSLGRAFPLGRAFALAFSHHRCFWICHGFWICFWQQRRSGRKRPRCPEKKLLASVSHDPRLHVKGKVDVVLKTANFWPKNLCFSKGRLEIWSDWTELWAKTTKVSWKNLLVSVSYETRLHVKGKVDVVCSVCAKTMNYWPEKLCFSKGRLEIWSLQLNWGLGENDLGVLKKIC